MSHGSAKVIVRPIGKLSVRDSRNQEEDIKVYSNGRGEDQRLRRRNSAQSTDSNKIESEDVDVKVNSSTNLLALLTEAAKSVNPVQFQLPPEYTPPIAFPGSSKKSNSHHHHSSKNKKQPHELDNGLVPFPIKVCFKCVRSCRKAPLIQCDYCPLLYHLDCLEPPLTTLPATRWMCPNHIEPALEEKCLLTDNLSERIELWKKCRTKISDEDVKLNFLRKVHHKGKPYRCNLKDGPVNCVKVPQAIKDLYDNPPSLTSYSKQSESDNLPDELEWRLNRMCQKEVHALKSMMALQSGSAIFSSQINDPKSDWKDSDDTDSQTTDSASESQSVEDDQTAINETPKMNGGSVDIIVNNEKPTNAFDGNQSHQIRKAHRKINSALNPPKSYRSLSDHSLLSTNHLITPNCERSDDKVVKFYFRQKDNLVVPIEDSRMKEKVLKEEILPTVDYPQRLKARAVLCPVQPKTSNGAKSKTFRRMSAPLIPMTYRTLTIGIGANNDVQLVKYGHCNYLSANHACIFYDEVRIS